MRKLIRCGRLFTGNETNALSDQTLVIEDDKVVFAGPAAKAPEAAPHDEVIAFRDAWPLIDSHVHLSYGNAKTQEDIDLYASLEFRAIRGLEAAQRVLRGLYSDGRSEYQRPRQPRGARRDRGGIVRRPARQQLRARCARGWMTGIRDGLACPKPPSCAGAQRRRRDRGGSRPGQGRRELCQAGDGR